MPQAFPWQRAPLFRWPPRRAPIYISLPLSLDLYIYIYATCNLATSFPMATSPFTSVGRAPIYISILFSLDMHIYICLTCILATSFPMATSPSISVAAATGTDLYISTPLSRPVYIHICHLHLSHELSHGDEPLHLGDRHSGHRSVYIYPSL